MAYDTIHRDCINTIWGDGRVADPRCEAGKRRSWQGQVVRGTPSCAHCEVANAALVHGRNMGALGYRQSGTGRARYEEVTPEVELGAAVRVGHCGELAGDGPRGANAAVPQLLPERHLKLRGLKWQVLHERVRRRRALDDLRSRAWPCRPGFTT